jgi:hypothetical protein
VDPEQDEGPQDDGEGSGHDVVDAVQVGEEVVLGGHDAADDHVDEDPDGYAHGPTVVRVRCDLALPRGVVVSDKSPKKDSSKKEGKSLKEKRSAKKIKQADKASKNA